MAAGWNTGDSFTDAHVKNFMIDQARAERDTGAVMTRVVDRQTLTNNQGYSWEESVVLRFDEPQGITEQTILNDFRRYETDQISITPTQVGMAVLWTDRSKKRLNSKVLAQTTVQVQKAFEKKKDKDLIDLFALFAAGGAGAGNTLTQGHIGAAAALNSTGRLDEPWDGPQATVIHPYQLHDLESELLTGLTLSPIPNGLTESTYKMGYKGMVRDTEVFVSQNIERDTADDATGATFARGNGGAIVYVQGMSPSVESKRAPEKGGGAEETYHYDDYGQGVRQVDWGTRIISDITNPTS